MKIVSLVFVILPHLLLQGPDDWKLEKNKDGVQVYTRLRAGEKFREFKAITRLNVSLSAAVALVRDAEVTHEWYNHVLSGEVLEKYDDQRSVVHLKLNFPFPATDRDIVVHFDYRQDPETGAVVAEVTGRPDFIPELNGLIRVQRIEGSWLFTPISDDLVEVEYQFFTDPGGSLPVWLVNMFIVDDPFKSLKRMKEFVRQDKYQSAKISFIKYE